MPISFENFKPQGEHVSSLMEQIRQDKLFHAILITGDEGTGKKTLSDLIARAVLCRSEESVRPCGRCKSCLMIDAKSHPDYILIQKGVPLAPDIKKDRGTIPVEDIREMIRITSSHSFEGGKRVVVVHDADKMTPQAQNCLLKTLEDPPEDTVFILNCKRAEQLLPTVVSRCRQFRLHNWSNEYIYTVLTRAGYNPDIASRASIDSGGSVGIALKLAGDREYWEKRKEITETFLGIKQRSDILRVSSVWKDRKDEADILFYIMESEFDRLLHFSCLREKDLSVSLPDDIPDSWKSFFEKARISDFCLLFDAISAARKQVQSAVNFQSVIEQFLFMMMEVKYK